MTVRVRVLLIETVPALIGCARATLRAYDEDHHACTNTKSGAALGSDTRQLGDCRRGAGFSLPRCAGHFAFRPAIRCGAGDSGAIAHSAGDNRAAAQPGPSNNEPPSGPCRTGCNSCKAGGATGVPAGAACACLTHG